MCSAQHRVLFEHTVRSIAEASKEVKIRHIGNCPKADPAYGERVAKAIGINLSEIPKK